jgi:DNA-binding XRE family transcriptional regulator
VQNTEILQIIGRNIAAARLRAGMTQECLAELVDVHWKTISSIERGRYPFAVTTLIRICSHLDVSLAEVCDGVTIKKTRAAERTAKALQRKRRPPG